MMRTFTILPVLGVKNDVPDDDPSLFVMASQDGSVVKAHCVDGRNVDFSRTPNACSKSSGRAAWSNTATSTTTNCLGIFELNDGTNTTQWIFMGDDSSNGRIFRYDGNRDPVRISDVAGHAGATEFAYNASDFYSVIRFGDYMVFADYGEHTPYCSDYDDTTVAKLISGGTEYKFRYLESWQRRIIGAYSDQTNGDIEIRWSNALPTPASDCEFASGNQLYVPNDDPITGIKRMGRNNCYVYCEDSINRLIYYPNYSTPFGISTVVENFGAENHHCVVDIGNLHFLYNQNYGFCMFDGQNFTPISQDIDDWVSTIRDTYNVTIVGSPVLNKNEVVWTVPLEGSSTPNALLFYDYRLKQWRRKDISMRYVYPMQVVSDTTWSDLSGLGYTTWSDLGNLRWADLYSEQDALVFSGTDGHLYYDSTESDAGSDWDGYRVEPILDFGRPEDKDLLLEIWFNLYQIGDYSLYVYYRGGDTVGECRAQGWTALSEVSCDSPSNAVCRLAETNRFHQIKWGTDAENEAFVVRSIQFKYVPQGRY